MIYPILVAGHPTLRKKAEEIDKNYPNFQEIIANMYETMQHAEGVGLAAPQVGFPIRLFVVDATPFAEDYPEVKDFRKTFINPRIVEEFGEEWYFNEGCLSVPGIREDVLRKSNVRLTYYDQNWQFHEEVFTGIVGRIIQHEYDHLEGILFTDKISPLKKRLLKRKLLEIAKGNVNTSYRIKNNL